MRRPTDIVPPAGLAARALRVGRRTSYPNIFRLCRCPGHSRALSSGSLMLTFFNGGHEQFCDGISRRSFLKAGGLAIGGLALSDFLRLKAQGAISPDRR